MNSLRTLFSNFFGRKRIYLDYAAATPVASEVFAAMKPYIMENFGNASAIHAEGVAARKAVENARTHIASVLDIRKPDVIFTSGGTESNQLALLGIIDALIRGGRTYENMEVVSSRIEHPSMLAALHTLELRGVLVRYVRPDADGLIQSSAVKAELSPRTVLLALSYVNSEIGVVQDVKRIARTVRAYEKEAGTRIYIHLDACQAPLWLPCRMEKLGVDLMALDSGKCYGPKGIGVLARRHGVPLLSQLQGGGQEMGLRAGTENTSLIVGCATALVRAQKKWEERSARVAALRELFFNELTTRIEGVVVNGSRDTRVANNVNISIPGIDTEFAVVSLDAQGIAASTKSACAGARGTGSTVVHEISSDAARAASTIRFSLGEATTRNEIIKTAQVLAAHVEKMRAFHTRKKEN